MLIQEMLPRINFFQKVIEAEVKIIAITNHNQFDYMQYKEFKDVTEGYCDIGQG